MFGALNVVEMQYLQFSIADLKSIKKSYKKDIINELTTIFHYFTENELILMDFSHIPLKEKPQRLLCPQTRKR